MTEASTRRVQPDTVVLVWVIALFAITGIGILPLFLYRIDLSKLTFSSSVPVIAGIGIELTAYAPTLAALLVAGFIVRNAGIRNLLRPVIRWRVGVHWYLIALAGPSVLFVVGDLIRLFVGAPLPTSWFAIPSAGAAAFLLGALIAGSFGEEVGWRGLGQPRLQQQYGAFWAAIIVGSVWSLWHLWPAVAPGGIATMTWSDAELTFLRLISTSIVYAWLYNNTGGSLLIVMLAHAGHNIAVRIVPTAESVTHGDPVVAGLYAVAAVAVVFVAGGRWLTRSHVFPDPPPTLPHDDRDGPVGIDHSSFRTGCLTVLTVASTDIQLCAHTKSLSSKFRSADRRDKLRSLVSRFSTNLCPGCAPASADDVQNRRF